MVCSVVILTPKLKTIFFKRESTHSSTISTQLSQQAVEQSSVTIQSYQNIVLHKSRLM